MKERNPEFVMNMILSIPILMAMLLLVFGLIIAEGDTIEEKLDSFNNAKYYNSEFYKQTEMSPDEYIINENNEMLSATLDKVGGKVNLSDNSVLVGDTLYYIINGPYKYGNTIVVRDEETWEYKIGSVKEEIPNLYKGCINKGYNDVVIVAHHKIKIFDPLNLGYVKHLDEIITP